MTWAGTRTFTRKFVLLLVSSFSIFACCSESKPNFVPPFYFDTRFLKEAKAGDTAFLAFQFIRGFLEKKDRIEGTIELFNGASGEFPSKFTVDFNSGDTVRIPGWILPVADTLSGVSLKLSYLDHTDENGITFYRRLWKQWAFGGVQRDGEAAIPIVILDSTNFNSGWDDRPPENLAESIAVGIWIDSIARGLKEPVDWSKFEQRGGGKLTQQDIMRNLEQVGALTDDDRQQIMDGDVMYERLRGETKFRRLFKMDSTDTAYRKWLDSAHAYWKMPSEVLLGLHIETATQHLYFDSIGIKPEPTDSAGVFKATLPLTRLKELETRKILWYYLEGPMGPSKSGTRPEGNLGDAPGTTQTVDLCQVGDRGPACPN